MGSKDDVLVWSMQAGSILTCTRDLVMEGSGEIAFTAGVSYAVNTVHPIAEPAFLRLLDNQGVSHALQASDLREYFGK